MPCCSWQLRTVKLVITYTSCFQRLMQVALMYIQYPCTHITLYSDNQWTSGLCHWHCHVTVIGTVTWLSCDTTHQCGNIAVLQFIGHCILWRDRKGCCCHGDTKMAALLRTAFTHNTSNDIRSQHILDIEMDAYLNCKAMAVYNCPLMLMYT